MRPNTKTGLTLIELLLVMGIIGLLAAVALPNFRDMKQRNDLNATQALILHTLEQARSRAMSGIGTSNHGVTIEENRLIAFESATQEESGEERSIPLPYGVTTNHHDTDITFERLTGYVIDSPAEGYTVTAIDSDGSSSTIHVQPNGTIYAQE